MTYGSKCVSAPTVLDAADRIRNGSLTPGELIAHSLKAIETHNPTLNAFGDIYTETAAAEAETLTREASRGCFRGPLHGIPFGVKDLFSTAGLRTTRGSLTALDYVPSDDAPIIRRLKDAGAIIVGKTATTEFGWSGASLSRVFGNGRNPWNPQLTSGGSSSGSAIAVAARMVPASLGSDGGGSVRIPSAFCGTFALKGSLGRIPTWPWSATEMLSHAGPITRTVRDSALLFDVLSGPDPRDHQALPAPTETFLARCDSPLRPLRVAFCPTLFNVDVDPAVAAAVEAAVNQIARTLPVTIDMPALEWHDPLPTFEALWVGGRGIVYGKSLANRKEELEPGFATLIERSADYDLAGYLTAVQQRAAFACKVHKLFERFDLLLTPTLPILPFDADRIAPSDLDGVDDTAVPWARWTPFTYPFNLSGNPAASVPCGWSPSGLPIGLQVIGPRFADGDVLQFCAAFEAIAPWEHRLPPLLVG
ncbi:amidase [Paraburkholderia sprentiae WSM5005]|uniref:Amidase n=1 Tax=Paraburkholderia sprentiae WSM5005 TaxID=754502 RepID=A0A1I9YN90_9BURK|nr:amidase family protein [Paraburkholderia sprentiae]APA87773.1 amidase [Paraburkholderia sprentiae WSM5005]